MIKFDGRIVQFGFGAVGKSFYEKLSQEIKFNENKYYVITMDKDEYRAYINLGGIAENFITCEITRENYIEVFKKYLGEGDLLIDFAESVGTREICQWCAENNVMYIDTGETDWSDNWYNIFDENIKKNDLRNQYKNSSIKNKYPIVLQHGNNPGLVSHFLKAGIEYIAKTQYKLDVKLHKLIKNNKFNEASQLLGIKIIHVNDIDLQEIKDSYNTNKLFSTWSIDSFFFEMLSEATLNVGTSEKIDYEDKCKRIDYKNGFLEFNKLANDIKCRTYYPNGLFEGFMVPHEETITIAKNLEVKEGDNVIYRPSVMFVYSPCEYARKYFDDSKVNDYPNPNILENSEIINGDTIVRGHLYPKDAEIIYKEKISSGTEYVGVLIIGENFKPVWVGNRVETSFLYKHKMLSYWQTPTITPVAMSALAATCWMIKNKNKGGIYFPDDIEDYKYIIKTAEKYISKTIYKTFDKNIIQDKMKIDFNNLQSKDAFVE